MKHARTRYELLSMARSSSSSTAQLSVAILARIRRWAVEARAAPTAGFRIMSRSKLYRLAGPQLSDDRYALTAPSSLARPARIGNLAPGRSDEPILGVRNPGKNALFRGAAVVLLLWAAAFPVRRPYGKWRLK